MVSFRSWKLDLLLGSYFLIAVSMELVSVNGLNIGPQSSGSSVQVSKECSRKCESDFCSVPPLLKYGKYCGLLYSGCPGEKPCDGLDACCMKHDACVQARDNLRMKSDSAGTPVIFFVHPLLFKDEKKNKNETVLDGNM